jgi:hypothetical protein
MQNQLISAPSWRIISGAGLSAFGAIKGLQPISGSEISRDSERRKPMNFEQLKENWNQENSQQLGERYGQSREGRFAGNYTRSGGRLPPPRVDQSAGCEFL